jgi:serine phosphatase RsbU (regulator of sigma subunit)/pSer/pThr/pTyr-binding forkhead associated (FHA) protein
MALLTVIKPQSQYGTKYQLKEEETVLGREADCHVVINVPAVSRRHALIRRLEGKFYIEDLKSRNKTFVNREEVTTRLLLKNNDKIKICDNEFVFNDAPEKPPLPAELTRGTNEKDEDDGSSSTVEASLHPSSKHILEAQPAEKLARLLEITADLTGTFDTDQILPKIVESLFQVFKQADRAFVILADGDRLVPKVIKTRRGDETSARFSRKIVRICLEEGKGLLSEDASSDSKFDLSQSIADCRIRSVIVAPMKGRTSDKPFGVIQLDTQDRQKKFNEDDLKLLMAVAGQAAIALENARMHQTLVARAGLERDLRLAHQVQLSFLPKTFPRVKGYDFFAHYASAQEVGGDYYDFISLPSQKIGITIGDVAGKGVAAALLMARVSSDARYTLLTESGPAAAIIKLNTLMQEAGMLDRFVTLEAALLDAAKHEVTFVNAGHNPAVVCRHASGKMEEAFSHKVGGYPLGVVDHYDYEVCTTVRLDPGDSIILFSDGVTESKNKKEEDFGMEGLLSALKGSPQTPTAMGQRLIDAVKLHSLGCKQHDDITVVCFGRTMS